METEDVVISAIIAANILFSDDDSEDELSELIVALSKNSKIVPKLLNYIEITVPQFDNSVFKSHFRMDRSAFDRLHQKLYPYT